MTCHNMTYYNSNEGGLPGHRPDSRSRADRLRKARDRTARAYTIETNTTLI